MTIENEQEKKSERWMLASPVQERIYISNMLLPDKTSYNVTTKFKIHGDIDETKLLDSLNQTINNNELLRAKFTYGAGKLEYYITDKKIDIEVIRMDSGLNLDECEKKALDGFIRPFRMVDDILCRVRVVFLNSQIALILLDCHFSIFDSNSASVFAKDLQYYYESKFINKKETDETFSEWQWKNIKSASEYEILDISLNEFEMMKKEFTGTVDKIYELTPLQQGMLFHNLEDAASTGYVLQSIYKVGAEMNGDSIKEALHLLSNRYEILRTSFIYRNVLEPKQVIYQARNPEYNFEDLTELSEEEKERRYETLVRQDVERGFDLQEDRLLRITYVKYGDNDVRLMWSMHHIIVDGSCLGILMTEFMKYYAKIEDGIQLSELKETVLEEKKEQGEYSDYVHWLRKQEQETAKEYWNELLNDYDSICEITPMNKPEESNDEQMRRQRMAVNQKVTSSLQQFAQQNGSTINTVAEVICGIMLQGHTGNEDVVFGKVVSGRNADIKGIEDMVGLFVNTIPVRVKTENKMTIKELLKNQQEQGNESTSYDYYSLAEIQNETLQGTELIKVLYVFENYMSGLEVEQQENVQGQMTIALEQGREQTHYAITISGYVVDGTLCFDMMYNPNQFTDEEIHLLLERLVKISEEIAENPERQVTEIETVTEIEKEKILHDFNATKTVYPREKTVIELFEEQAAKTPDQIALVFEEEEVSYRELNERANVLAHKLREQGIRPDDFVAIMAERSIEMIAGIYGIIKAGAAYVPIDPTYPEERIAFMLEDCQPKAMLLYGVEYETDRTKIDLEESGTWEGNTENPDKVNKAEDLIYCIYTSGTTGTPKGTLLEHRGVVSLKYMFERNLEITPADNIIQFANYIFDASVWEMSMALLNGATLVCMPVEVGQNPKLFNEYCKQNEVTVATLPPNYYLQKEVDVEFRKLVTAGSESSMALLNKVGDRSYLNAYGPTETTVCASYWEKEENWDGTIVPIGKPISNTQIYILNGNNLCGIGVPGELCIAGDGLARGYLNRPELTEEQFVKNPFGEGRMYRSGDLARWLPNGNIEYLGRIDEQVKIRGFRIELGEIESRIREIEGIHDSAVIAKEDPNGDQALYAYYKGESVSVSEIRDRLASVLPEYMIPSYMMEIDSIPVTRNGKLDKRALPEIEIKAAQEYVAPSNETEEIICNIFGDILSIENVGVKDSFFELGGHSLRANRLVNKIESEMGYRIALKDVFSHPTPEKLSQIVLENETEEYTPIPRAEEKEYYAMSSAQKRTYLIQQMVPEGTMYNMPQALKLTGEVNVENLKEALQGIVERHEILRTEFLMVNGEAVQNVLETVEVPFEYEEASHRTDEEEMELFVRAFDLSKAPQIRARFVKRDTYNLLMLDIHHIVGDGMSIATFMNEWIALYKGETPESLSHQFKDYSEWMRSRDLGSQREYWLSQFEGEIPVLDMPLDYARPQEQSFEGSNTESILDKELVGKIKALAKKTGTTEYMVFLSAAMVLLGKYSRQEDIVIGSPISGRTHRDTEGMLGMFVNTLAMRGRPEKEKRFEDFLLEMKEVCLKAYENQEYPFEELVEEAHVQRDLSRNPLFDVMLVLQNNEKAELSLGETEVEEQSITGTVAKFDLAFNIEEYEEQYSVMLEYGTALYKEETVKQILKHYEEVLRQVVDQKDCLLEQVGMVTETEKEKILDDFNATKTVYPREKTVIELFEEQAAKTPDQNALVFEGEEVSYRELNERANVLAHKLREQGIRPDDFVAIMAERSIEMIAGIYGVIKAGAAYVPIDPTYPEERIAFMLEDSQPKAMLLYGVEYETDRTKIDLKEPGTWEGNTENPDKVNKAEDLIYCIYTSGTTGTPKGTLLEHRGVVSLKYMFERNLEITPADNIIQFANYIFDASVWEMSMALLNGATLVCMPAEVGQNPKLFNEYCKQNEVTVATLPPNYYLQKEVDVEFRKLVTAGSESSMALLNKVGDRSYLNAYGPTETTVCASYWEKEENWDGTIVPIGKPISNTQIYILNGNNLCGIGVPGELCIAGDGLARGYLNRPELTEEQFVKNPFGEGRMYRSGDLARWLPDGNIEYLGRIDEQVKIRGFRIELGEIESRIREIEGIHDSAVIAKADPNGDQALYAYYTGQGKEMSEIRDRLRERLPEYMIPSYMMEIDSIPVTRSGKLDKKALPKIEVKATREYVAPRNNKERIVCEAFGTLLNVEEVGVKENFFELGGDSIKAIRIISNLRNVGYHVTVRDIMDGKTAERIALAMKETENQRKYEQGEINGFVPKTPIIKMFDFWNLEKPEHFNQAMMFPVAGIDNTQIKQVIEELIKHHDILRAVYRNQQLEILPIRESKWFDFYAFDYRGKDNVQQAIEDQCSEIQASINLETGPLVKIAVFETDLDKVMMFCVHHLAIDGVSWRIVAEDFEIAVGQIKNGKEVKLPEKTASFKEWAESLEKYAMSPELRNDRIYWQDVITNLQIDKQIENESDDKIILDSIHITINKEETYQLLHNVYKTYNTKIDDILLCALVRAVNQWNGGQKVSVSIEGHGREETPHKLDVDRTIGWFTIVYPVIFEYYEDLKTSIILTKETLRDVPNKGFTFGLMDNAQECQTDISFNYLGQIVENTELDYSKYSAGKMMATENHTKANLTFNGGVNNDELTFEIYFNKCVFEKDAIKNLGNKYIEMLQEIIEHCIQSADSVLTISDLDTNDLDDDDMSIINDLFEFV